MQIKGDPSSDTRRVHVSKPMTLKQSFDTNVCPSRLAMVIVMKTGYYCRLYKSSPWCLSQLRPLGGFIFLKNLVKLLSRLFSL